MLSTDPPTILSARITPHESVHEGSNVTLTCEVSGRPAPDVHWFYKNEQTQLSTNLSLTASVTLDKVTPLDSREYWCMAHNEIPPPAYMSALLSVRGN